MKTPPFVAELVAQDETGSMSTFITLAINEYADRVASFSAEQITKDTRGWVDGHDLLSCAQTVRRWRQKRTRTIAAECTIRDVAHNPEVEDETA